VASLREWTRQQRRRAAMGCGAHGKIRDNQVFREYDFFMKMGRGATSQVHEAVSKKGQLPFAIKCVVREEAEAHGCDDLQKVKSTWGLLEHPNICRLYATFQDHVLHYFVMEMCGGGTLFQLLEDEVVLEEDQAANYGRQMSSALAYLHGKEICHRDVKPESWLMSDKTPDARPMLINFTLAELCLSENNMTQPCGTLHYLAPEVLRGNYGKRADVWSLGVILFLALYASYPFDGESVQQVMSSILTSEPAWCDSCQSLSNDASDLLRKLLTKEPDQRISASLALEHSFLRGKAQAKASPPSVTAAVDRQSKILSQQMQLPGSDRPGKAGPRRSFMVTSALVQEMRSCPPARTMLAKPFEEEEEEEEQEGWNHPFAVVPNG